MPLAHWCTTVGPPGPYRRKIAKLYAFLGRYAHQQVHDMEQRTVREITRLAEATREILDEEKAQFDNLRESD